MQFILLLLLIIGVTVVMALVLAGISYAFGVQLHRRNGTLAVPTERDPCAQSNADLDWYLSLPYWQQYAITAWWWANRFRWAAKGCE